MANVLIFCEESQRSCIAFRKQGHNAFSCDIKYCSGGHPEWHIQMDGLPLLNGYCSFITCDGKIHHDVLNSKWDLIISHPPCTFLSNVSASLLFTHEGRIKNQRRFDLGLEAKQFFLKCLNADCEKIVVENPKPLGIFNLPAYSQIIQPYMFGDPYTKATYLWIKGCPLLYPTHSINDYSSIVSYYSTASSSVKRSKTFEGIANAFATQLLDDSLPLQLTIFM